MRLHEELNKKIELHQSLEIKLEETNRELIESKKELDQAKESLYLAQTERMKSDYKETFGIDCVYIEKSLLREIDKILKNN